MKKKNCFLFLLFVCLFSITSCQTHYNRAGERDSSIREVPNIIIKQANTKEMPLVDFYNHICSYTVILEKGKVVMWKTISDYEQIGDVDSIPFYTVIFDIEGFYTEIDNIMGYGRPILMKNKRIILFPIVQYQYEDMEFGGVLLSIDVKNHQVDTINNLSNSIAFTVVDDICYYISEANLYSYQMSTGENLLRATLSDEENGSFMAFFSLCEKSSGCYTLTYYSDFSNDILNGVSGKESIIKF